MADQAPDNHAIVAAFAARAGLNLSPEEHAKLVEYVKDSWDMADRLRDVPSPGHEGVRDKLPLRSAWANRPPDPGTYVEPTTPLAQAGQPRPVPSEVLVGTVMDAARKIAAGELSPLDLVAAQLDRIARYDGAVRSYITVDREGALVAAARLTEELAAKGPRSPLHGMPFGAKDSIPAAGVRNTYNSPLTKDWVPKRDAESVRRLRFAGAVLLGKHNLNEFGWSLPREDDLAAPPRNPWFPEEYSVGSTSGGGAAAAAGLAMFSLGTDGGGSARLPGGQHLLFGLKPGHGRVPKDGVSGGRVSEVSVLARAADDVAAVLAALVTDPDEPGAAERLRRDTAAWLEHVRSEPRGLRLAVPDGYVEDVGMEDSVRRAYDATLAAAEELGHQVMHLPRPVLDILHAGVRANFVVIAAEHYFDHEFPGKDRRNYGASAGFYNLPGAFLTAADYMHALRVGGLVREAVDEVLADVDALILPSSPVTRTSTARNPKTHRRGGNAAYTSPFNISGHPGVSLPVGLSDEGIPIGVQLVGRYGSEFDLLRAARQLSGAFDLPPYPDPEGLVSRYGG